MFDNPELIVTCVVGDGEAETGPLATSWHSNKFLNPATDGAVLPILHLNGYKIAGPTVLARIEPEELDSLLKGYGWTPHYVEGDDPAKMHRLMADTLDQIIPEIKRIQREARTNGFKTRPRWPMIVLRSPKGWTGPDKVDGVQILGTFRAHQVPLEEVKTNPAHLKLLEAWLKSYKPEELFDEHGTLRAEYAELAPTGVRRMGANPHANGGLLLHDLALPDFDAYAVKVEQPGKTMGEATRVQGTYLRDVMKDNPTTFRLMSPDETASNRLSAVFDVTVRDSTARVYDYDDHVGPTGRVMEMLSEHQCEGWLEGYLLTGRHGLLQQLRGVPAHRRQHVQPAREVAGGVPEDPVAAADRVAELHDLSSHVWRQDHNGFTHQDPGFVNVVMDKKPSVVRVYYPPDANCLLSVTDHVLRSRELRQRRHRPASSRPRSGSTWTTADQALRRRHQHLDVGVQRRADRRRRRWRRPGRRHGLLRRRADDGDAGGRVDPPRVSSPT